MNILKVTEKLEKKIKTSTILNDLSIKLDGGCSFGNGYILFEEKIDKKEIFLGTKGLDNPEINDTEIGILSLNSEHEVEHIGQKFYDFRKPGTFLEKEMAKEVMFCRSNYGLYIYNYEHLVHEIKAEGSALLKTPDMVKDIFPDLDIISILVQSYINNPLFIETDNRDTYESILVKFNSLLSQDNLPKKEFNFEKINNISFYNKQPRDVICRFLDSTGRVDEFEKYINSLPPIEQDTVLLATNILAIQPDMVTLDKYSDFQEMYKNYTVIDSKERYNIEKQKDFLKDLLDVEPEQNFSSRR